MYLNRCRLKGQKGVYRIIGVVPRGRIELPTQGFSVLRSTTELPRLKGGELPRPSLEF